MEYGWVIAFRDKEGFELAYHETHDGNPLGKITVYSNKHQAERVLEELKRDLAHALQYGVEYIEKVRYWLFFTKDVKRYMSLDTEKYRAYENLWNTLHLKQAKIA